MGYQNLRDIIYERLLIILFIVIVSIPDKHRRSSHRSRNSLPVREKERFPFPAIGDLEIILRPKFHEELESHDLFHLYQSQVIFKNAGFKLEITNCNENYHIPFEYPKKLVLNWPYKRTTASNMCCLILIRLGYSLALGSSR